MDVLRSDLRNAIRTLRRQPVFSFSAVSVLALGIGAPATIFAIASAFLLRPLPVREPEALRYLYVTSSDGSSFHSFSYPMYQALREQSRSTQGIAAFDIAPLSVSTDGDAALSLGIVTSWNYFRVLGVSPALGRFFLPEEEVTPRTHPVAIATYDFWRTRLNGDARAVGRTITINGHPFTVIGVAPPGFRGTTPFMKAELFTPIMMMPVTNPTFPLDRWEANSFQVFARVPAGSNDEMTERTLDALSKQIAARHGDALRGQGIDMHPLTSLPTEATRAVSLFMGMLLVFSLLILLVAGGNVAAMLLARAIRRRRDLTIRVALGARRIRLVRQLATETVLLFLAGSMGALAVAWGASRALIAFKPPIDVPLALDVPIDLRVITFTVGISLVAGVLIGLLSALRATRGDLTPRLKEGSAGAFARSRTWNVLVAGQVAFTVLLLAGAGLVLRALQRAGTIDTGLTVHNVFIASTDFRMRNFDAARGREAVRQWGDRVAALPGVEGVAFARLAPMGLSNSTTGLLIEGRAVSRDSVLTVDFNTVSASYFPLMRIPVIAGRGFGDQDVTTSPRVVVVSDALARRWFGNAANAVDRLVRFNPNDTTRGQIVGVVADTKVRSIAESPRPYVYFPITQSGVGEVTLLARTTRPNVQMASLIRAALREVDPGLPLMSAMSFEQHIGIALVPQRLAGIVSATLGLAGLLLAATGIYGIVAYAVSNRTREIGVRVAVGATPASVVRLMAGHGLVLTSAGLVVGMLLASGASRLLTPFLLGVSPNDVPTFVVVALVALVVASAACVIPARRAARVDPVIALRSD